MNRCLAHAIALAIGASLIQPAAAQGPPTTAVVVPRPKPPVPPVLPPADQVLDVLRHANGETTTAPKGAVVTSPAPINETGDSLFFPARRTRPAATTAQPGPTRFVTPSATPQ
jgi:hypothetical protein